MQGRMRVLRAPEYGNQIKQMPSGFNFGARVAMVSAPL